MVTTLAKQTLETVLQVSAPMLGAGLIVGIIISVIQIVTSIHDTALAFVPRIVVTFIVFLIVFPWTTIFGIGSITLTQIPPPVQPSTLFCSISVRPIVGLSPVLAKSVPPFTMIAG